MGQESEYVDLGLPLGLGSLKVCLGIPGPRGRNVEDDRRGPALMPTLKVCRRLGLDTEPLGREEIVGSPLIMDAIRREPERVGDAVRPPAATSAKWAISRPRYAAAGGLTPGGSAAGAEPPPTYAVADA